MSKNNEIRNIVDEILDFMGKCNEEVCIECQKEMIEEIIRRRINQMKGGRK